MHVLSCYFANINLLVFCRSGFRRRRLCLSSLLGVLGRLEKWIIIFLLEYPVGTSGEERGTGLFSKSDLVVCCHGVGAKE